MKRVTALIILTALLLVAQTASAQCTFHMSPGASPEGSHAWLETFGQAAEVDFESFGSGDSVASLAVSPMNSGMSPIVTNAGAVGGTDAQTTIHVGLDGLGGPHPAAEAFTSGVFDTEGAVHHTALLNRHQGQLSSRIKLGFSQPVWSVGAFVFDDSAATLNTFRMHVVDVHGKTCVSPVLSADNGITHTIEGFIGVSNPAGIVSVSYEVLDDAADNDAPTPTAAPFEIDHLHVGPVVRNAQNADLSGADLYNANLQYTNLYGANLSDAYLYGADLSGADIRHANLHSADLRYTNARSALAWYADLSDADLYNAALEAADLRGSTLGDAYLAGVDLSYADLSYADLSGAVLRYANLSGATAWFTDLDGADLYDVDLGGADMQGSHMDGVDLRGAGLGGADLRYTSLAGADLRYANLAGVLLDGAMYTSDTLWLFGFNPQNHGAVLSATDAIESDAAQSARESDAAQSIRDVMANALPTSTEQHVFESTMIGKMSHLTQTVSEEPPWSERTVYVPSNTGHVAEEHD